MEAVGPDDEINLSLRCVLEANVCVRSVVIYRGDAIAEDRLYPVVQQAVDRSGDVGDL